MARKFITAALPYVNNQPHLGNLIGSILSGDVYNRYCKKRGDDTVFISGTDEYGTATEMEALKRRTTPDIIVSQNRIIHQKIYSWFNCDFDVFGHTTCQEHTEIVQKIFKQCYENGYFEKENMEQFYCEKCLQYLADRFVEGECSFCGYMDARGDQCDKCGRCLKILELKNPRCSICGITPILKNTNHLFLRLDLLQDQIKEVMKDKIDNWTENAKNIYLEWLDKKLISRCMTRTLKYNWGVKVPLEGFEDKVFYVWFDAVIGYITFLTKSKEDWKEWVKDAKVIQFMGKDNVFFHSFIFPGILLASKNDSMIVDVINSTEFLNFNGKKFSKSNKIGIFGSDILDKDLGMSCYWRFYLLRRRPETKDSDFLNKEFKDLINSDLRSNLGNLCQRVLKYINAKCAGVVHVDFLDEDDEKFVEEINQLYNEYNYLMDNIKLRDGLAKGVEISSRANGYIQKLQDDKSNKDKLPKGYSIAYSAIVLLGHVFEPFIPVSCKKLFKMCSIDKCLFPEKFEIIRKANIVSNIEILFPELTKNQVANLDSFFN